MTVGHGQVVDRIYPDSSETQTRDTVEWVHATDHHFFFRTDDNEYFQLTRDGIQGPYLANLQVQGFALFRETTLAATNCGLFSKRRNQTHFEPIPETLDQYVSSVHSDSSGIWFGLDCKKPKLQSNCDIYRDLENPKVSAPLSCGMYHSQDLDFAQSSVLMLSHEEIVGEEEKLVAGVKFAFPFADWMIVGTHNDVHLLRAPSQVPYSSLLRTSSRGVLAARGLQPAAATRFFVLDEETIVTFQPSETSSELWLRLGQRLGSEPSTTVSEEDFILHRAISYGGSTLYLDLLGRRILQQRIGSGARTDFLEEIEFPDPLPWHPNLNLRQYSYRISKSDCCLLLASQRISFVLRGEGLELAPVPGIGTDLDFREIIQFGGRTILWGSEGIYEYFPDVDLLIETNIFSLLGLRVLPITSLEVKGDYVAKDQIGDPMKDLAPEDPQGEFEFGQYQEASSLKGLVSAGGLQTSDYFKPDVSWFFSRNLNLFARDDAGNFAIHQEGFVLTRPMMGLAVSITIYLFWLSFTVLVLAFLAPHFKIASLLVTSNPWAKWAGFGTVGIALSSRLIRSKLLQRAYQSSRRTPYDSGSFSEADSQAMERLTAQVSLGERVILVRYRHFSIDYPRLQRWIASFSTKRSREPESFEQRALRTFVVLESRVSSADADSAAIEKRLASQLSTLALIDSMDVARRVLRLGGFLIVLNHSGEKDSEESIRPLLTEFFRTHRESNLIFVTSKSLSIPDVGQVELF